MSRNCLGGNSPSAMWRSVRHTPQARTRSRTCPDRRRGLATSLICNGRWAIGCGAERIAAFMGESCRRYDARVGADVSIAVGTQPGCDVTCEVAVIASRFARPRTGRPGLHLRFALPRRQFECENFKWVEMECVCSCGGDHGFSITAPGTARGELLHAEGGQFQQRGKCCRELLRMIAGISERKDCFVRRPGCPAIHLQLSGVAADPMRVLENGGVGAGPLCGLRQ